MNNVTILAYIIEAVIVGSFAKIVYKPRFGLHYRFLIYLLVFGSMIIAHSSINVLRNVIFDVIAMIIIFCGAFDSRFIFAIYNAMFLEGINFLSELFFGNVSSHFRNDFWHEWFVDENYIILLFSKAMFFILTIVIAKNQKRQDFMQELSRKEGFLISGIVLCILTFLVILSNIAFVAPYSITIEHLLFWAIFDLIVVLFLTMLLFKNNEQMTRKIINMHLQLKRNEDNMIYIKSIEQKDEGLRILVHDIKNHLQSLAVLNSQGENEKVAEYIEGLLKKSNLKATVDISNNKLLNSIIYRYYLCALSQKVDFTYDIRNVETNYIEEIDLTSILCNILDNAFESCSGDSKFVDFSIYSGNIEKSIVISVRNSCATIPRKNKVGRYLSTKENGFHGFGIESVKKTVEKYNGDVNLYYKEDDHTFHTIVLLGGETNANSNM